MLKPKKINKLIELTWKSILIKPIVIREGEIMRKTSN